MSSPPNELDGVDLEQLKQMFMAEAREMIAALESGALALERSPEDASVINEVFRSAHTLKGAAATIGLSHIAELTHDLETMLDAWRSHTLTPTAAHFGAVLRASDMLARMIEQDPESCDVVQVAEIRAELRRLSGTSEAAHEAPTPQPAAAAATATRMRVRMAPAPEAFQCGGDPLLVFRELRSLCSQCSISVRDEALPALDELAPDQAYFAWELNLVLLPGVDEARVRDAFSFFDGVTQLEITLDRPQSAPPTAAKSQPEAARAPAPAPDKDKDASTLRVATDKIDKVIDLVGELVIAHSAVRELVKMLAPAKGMALQEAVLLEARHLRELQERVMAVRMVPVGTAFARLPRLVRDLSQRLGKNVQLELKGGDTELDKTMIEKLGDPLLHLVRNSLDHGIETPAERSAAGKPESATLTASAVARSGSVFIEVRDDGRGLDRERIRSRAITRGLISESDVLSDEQVYKLICSAGFSTKDEVSDLSGRGVGLDVVQRNIEELGGALTIESEPGLGACFSMRLPLTLTIVDGLILASGRETCVLPLLDVAFSLRIAPGQARVLAGTSEVLDLPNETLPLLDLGAVLGLQREAADPAQLAVIVHAGAYRYALRVDGLLGQTQAVVKSLETHYRRVPGIMGATILGNGKVALILDGQGVASAAGLRSSRGDSREKLARGVSSWTQGQTN